jgi:hypothetical protein
MADVPVIISFTRVPRIGSTPSNPPIFENPQDPVNPDGSGFGVDRFIALKDVSDSSYTSKVGFVPVVNAGETGLELVEAIPTIFGDQSPFTVFARGFGTGLPSFQALVLDHLPNNIGFGKLQNITGATVLGRQSGTGEIQQLTPAQARSTIGAIGGTIASGQVAFGTGANQIGGDAALIWDNVSRRLRLWVTGGATLRAVAAAFVIGSDSTTGNRIILRPDGDLSTANQIDINKGDLKFNGAQTIQTSTGNLTLATGGGNGNILLSPNGSGSVGISTTPTQKLDINGNVRIRSLTTNQGDFVQANATGVLQRRTASQVIEQLGISPSSYERDLFTFASSYSFTLTRNSPTAVQVFRNGQKKEFGDDWTISGNVVTINSTNVLLEVGDEISIEYFYSTPDIVPSNLNGTGQAGRLTKWNSSTELGISLIEESTGLISVLGKLNIQNVDNTAGNFLTINSGEVSQRTAAEAVNDLGIFGTGANQVRVNTDLDDRYLQDAPQDGEQYARKDGDWSQVIIPDPQQNILPLPLNRYIYSSLGNTSTRTWNRSGEHIYIPLPHMLFADSNMIADRIGFFITATDDNANVFIRLGIFEQNTETGEMIRVVDAGQVGTVETGTKEATINTELERGKMYYCLFARQGTDFVNVAIRQRGTGVGGEPYFYSTASPEQNINPYQGGAGSLTGAFDASYNPVTGAIENLPIIFMRLQNL